MACSESSKSRELALDGINVPRRQATQDHGNLTVFSFSHLLLLSHRSSSFQVIYFVGSHGTTKVTHRPLTFVTATDVVSVCVHVCRVSRRPTKWERRRSVEMEPINWKLRRGAGRYKPTIPRNLKSTPRSRGHTHYYYNSSNGTTVATVQNSCGTTAPALWPL